MRLPVERTATPRHEYLSLRHNPSISPTPISYPTGVLKRDSGTPISSARLTTTITSNHATSTGSSSFLASAVADSNLSWWQLLCILFAGLVALILGGYTWSRRRRKAAEVKKRNLEAAKATRDRELQARERRDKEELERELARKDRRGETRRKNSQDWSSDSDASTEESYDSVSDGGTIRPKRRRKGRSRGRERDRDRRKRHRRKDSYSSDTETDESNDSYASRRRRRRRDKSRDRDRDESRKGDRARRRLSISTPETSPPPLPIPAATKKRETNFRDSVFSTYNSMKQAAVRLKYVEAKAKLNKQLAQEERIEQARKAKIIEANREIEEAKRRERGDESAGSEQPLLIPPVSRPPITASSSGSSSRSHTALPPPPGRAVRKASAPVLPVHRGVQQVRRTPARQASAESYFPLQRKDPRASVAHDRFRPNPENARIGRVSPAETGFGGEIKKLLGAPPKKGAAYPNSLRGKGNTEAPDRAAVAPPKRNVGKQSDWLSHPAPNTMPSVPVSPRTSIYIPISHPKDRPIIPRGGLAPAPPPKAKAKPILPTPTIPEVPKGFADTSGPGGGGGVGRGAFTAVSNTMAGVGAGFAGAGARRWADRLRDRR